MLQHTKRIYLKAMPAAPKAENVIKDLDAVLDLWKDQPTLVLRDDKDPTITYTYEKILARRNELDDSLPGIETDERNLRAKKDVRDREAKALNKIQSRGKSLFRGLFGSDSVEYDKAGGVPDSKRKPRSPRKAAGGTKPGSA